MWSKPSAQIAKAFHQPFIELGPSNTLIYWSNLKIPLFQWQNGDHLSMNFPTNGAITSTTIPTKQNNENWD